MLNVGISELAGDVSTEWDYLEDLLYVTAAAAQMSSQVKSISAIFFQSHEELLGLKNKDALRWQQLYAPAWWLHRGPK